MIFFVFIKLFSNVFLDLSNEFWLMFLHMDYNTLGKNETKRESYRHIYILVASEKEGWLVIQSPALKETLNKTINRGKTVIELPKILKSTNITGVENKGIHVKASVPVSVFGYNEEYSNREGFYVIPAHSLSTEYMATTFTPVRGSLIGIVGINDNTLLNIHLKMTGTLFHNGHTYSNTDIISVELNKGMTFILSHKSDLTGTYIKGSKQISVISGNQCAFAWFSDYSLDCDPLREQLLPINKWGKEFIVPFFNFKDPTSILRIVANESNTRVLVVDNSTSSTRALCHGNFSDIQMTTNGPLYVNSNRPIQVSLIVNGAFSRSRNGFMSLVPSLKHYKDDYRFIVPRSHMHDNYELGCWQPGTMLKTRFIAITAEFNVINDIMYDNSQLPVNSTIRSIHVGDKKYSTISVRATEDYHTLHSNSASQKFGVIIYGACYSDLYGHGFPGGMNL